MRNPMTSMLNRREWLTGGLVIAGALMLPFPVFAATPEEDAVRRLIRKSTRNALEKLSQPEGYWTSPVSRIPLPTLFAGHEARKGALASDDFRLQLYHKINVFAAAGAAAAENWAPGAFDAIPLANPSAILHGGATAATSAIRIEIGSTLINAIIPAIYDAIHAAQDPMINQAITSLANVDEHDVARAIADEADNATWFQIGYEEAAIRQSPDAGGDADLARLLGKA